ncbi:MAG: GDP-mannose 4,6-dehydratase [Candidatus Nealsonbacteria bacterium]|nr:GDP-mannose 4,6-dehydratase [Candidatus Nealsonbacteria bacterium]
MKILITGGAGFIGSHLVDCLIEKGHKVVVIDNLSTGRKENLHPLLLSKKHGATPLFFKKGGGKFYKLDILSPEISRIFKQEKPEVVFHLAAQINVRKSVENPFEDARINILGALNVLENCKKVGVKKIIFTSSGGAIYGDAQITPTPEHSSARCFSPYAVAKLTTEQYLNYYYQVFGLPFTSLRLANVYGPRQDPRGEAGVVAIFIDKLLKKNKPVIFGNGRQTRDFVFVYDVVDSFLRVLNQQNCNNAIYNVGTGIETSINRLWQLVSKKIGKEIKPIFEPSKINGELKRSCLSYAKIKKELGWKPKYNLEQGLEKTVNYFKSF